MAKGIKVWAQLSLELLRWCEVRDGDETLVIRNRMDANQIS